MSRFYVRKTQHRLLSCCFLLLLLRATLASNNNQQSGGSSSSPVHSGRVVKTKYGNLRGMTIQSGTGATSYYSSAPAFTNLTQQFLFEKKNIYIYNTGSTSRKGSVGNVEAFLGVPYAAPPVGSLRYLPPASPGPWPGIRPAVHLSPACPQQYPHLTNR